MDVLMDVLNRYMNIDGMSSGHNFIMRPVVHQSWNLNTKELNDLPQLIRSGKHVRLLQLNLSKMLLRLPKALFLSEKELEPDPYENMMMISSVMKRKGQTTVKDNSVSLARIGPLYSTKNPTSTTAEDNVEAQLPHVISEAVVQTTKQLKNRYHCKKRYTVKKNLENASVEKQKKNVIPVNPKVALPQLSQEKKRGPLLVWDPLELKSIKSQSYAILEYPSQRVVLSHQASLSVEIASLTKIMTFYVVHKIGREKKIEFECEMVCICEAAAGLTGTSAEVEEGEEYTLEQLLYGLMLPSGNDAAISLAIWGGAFFTAQTTNKAKIKAFVEQMNIAAKDLALTASRYCNPHGLPHPQAKGNAMDVARLSCLCLSLPLFQQIVSTRFYKCIVRNKLKNKERAVQWQNTNKLLRRVGFLGIKTGITVTAGPCLATAYKFRGMTYVTVLLRAPKISGRFNETRRLLHWSLNKLYSDLSEGERKVLKALKRKNDDDSDYSEDQHEFKYNVKSSVEYKKRCNVLEYQM